MRFVRAAVLAAALLSAFLVTTEAAHAKGIAWWGNLGTANVDTITDAQLNELCDERGVRVMILQTRHLHGLNFQGNRFTGNLNDPAIDTSSAYELQRRIRDSQVIQRAHAACGMEIWFGHYGVVRPDTNASVHTPYSNWQDDAAWNTKVLPAVRNLAAACRVMGCKGILNDTEEYPDDSNVDRDGNGVRDPSHTWGYSYPGAPSRATLDTLVYRRGQQYMNALNEGYPGVRIVTYYAKFPYGFEEGARTARFGSQSNYYNLLHHRFWLGVLSASDPGNVVNFWDSWFYKGSQCNSTCWTADSDVRTPGVQPLMPAGTQNTMNDTVREAVRRFNLFFQPRLTAAQFARIGYGNVSWAPNGYARAGADDAQPVAKVRDQLLASRDLATTLHIPVYAHSHLPEWQLSGSSWTPIEPVLREAASVDPAPTPTPTPDPVDTTLVNHDGESFPPHRSITHSATIDVGDTVSIEMVLDRGSLGTLQVLMGKGGRAGITPAIAADNRLSFFGYGIGATARSTVALDQTGREYVVHFVSSPGVKRVYVDGVDVTTAASTTAAFQKTTNALVLGADQGGSAPFTGRMRDVKLYGRALTAPEVEARYAALRAVPDTDAG
jgi:Concanavalin A-like lectin/glucanases superfamily